MTITIETKSGVFEVAAPAGDNILYAALAAGIRVPYECATGTCGTCRARVMSGAVDPGWSAAPGAVKLKRDKGDILMCQAHAAGDCVVRVPSDVRQVPSPHPSRIEGRIAAATLLTHDVMEFEVDLASPLAFDAGQFAVVAAPGLVGGRAYSMVNHEAEARRLVFVVKRKPGGGFSEWLFAGTPLGAHITLFGALGRATLTPADAKDLVIVAGGSGIAGMMAILDAAAASGHFLRHRGSVFFGVRTLADGFYLDRLARHVATSSGAVDVTLVLSHEAPPGARHPRHPAIGLAHGFVHDAAGAALSGGAPGALAFVAGPPPMVDGALRTLLTQARIPPTSIRYDKFG
jgi:toluene monooxygenase electron transfer component